MRTLTFSLVLAGALGAASLLPGQAAANHPGYHAGYASGYHAGYHAGYPVNRAYYAPGVVYPRSAYYGGYGAGGYGYGGYGYGAGYYGGAAVVPGYAPAILPASYYPPAVYSGYYAAPSYYATPSYYASPGYYYP